MNKNAIIGVVVALVVVGSGSFYAGMKYNQNKNGMAFTPGAGGQGRAGAQRGGRGQGAGFINGEILSKDDKSVTIKLRDGGSKLVFFSGSTQIMKADPGTATDLTVGQNVMAAGNANSDGSINAQTIQIRPAGETFGNRAASSTK